MPLTESSIAAQKDRFLQSGWFNPLRRLQSMRLAVTAKLGQNPVSLSAKKLQQTLKLDRTDRFASARMSYNRLQALDGDGYRECHLDKIRSVSRENESKESNRDYWFGEVIKQPISNNASHLVTAQSDEGKESAIRQAIPSQARITSTRLQAYVDSTFKANE